MRAALSLRITRRTALSGLLLGGTAAWAAWHWPQRASERPAPADIGEDVCIVAPATPYDPASGLAPQAPREVPATARCPVCGMYPARARAWAAQVIFADGDAHFFDSPLSLMLYLREVGRYTRGRSAEAIVARYVSDTNRPGQWLDAQRAVYVAGSSALGPMRAGNLPAFADQASAQRFAAQRGGRAVAFDEIGTGLLQSLAPGRGPRHGPGEHPGTKG